MTSRAAGHRRRTTTPADLALRALVALGLIVDAVVHLRLASGYQAAAPGGIGEGTLFRIEAGVAVLAALAVLARPGRLAAALAFLVAAVGLVAVLLYRYVDIPAIGPLPSMYEPIWFGEKALSAAAEAIAAAGALALLLRTPPATRRHITPPHPSGTSSGQSSRIRRQRFLTNALSASPSAVSREAALARPTGE